VKVTSIIFAVFGIFDIVAGILMIVVLNSVLDTCRQFGVICTINGAFVFGIILVFSLAILNFSATSQGWKAVQEHSHHHAKRFFYLTITSAIIALTVFILRMSITDYEWSAYAGIGQIIFNAFAIWAAWRLRHHLEHHGGDSTIVVPGGYQQGYGAVPGQPVVYQQQPQMIYQQQPQVVYQPQPGQPQRY